jgi:hypothetical protein
MSANNLAPCPNCKQITEQKLEKMKTDAKKKYGKVTPEAYQECLEAIKEMAAKAEGRFPATLREDWEIGMWAGDFNFVVDYRCHCDVCKYEYSYKYSEGRPGGEDR